MLFWKWHNKDYDYKRKCRSYLPYGRWEKALTGTVKTVSSSIDFDFKNNKIKNIKFHGDPTSDLIPIRKEVLNPQKLSGFNWMGDYRPRDKDDISPVKIKILPLNTDKKEENIKKSNKEWSIVFRNKTNFHPRQKPQAHLLFLDFQLRQECLYKLNHLPEV